MAHEYQTSRYYLPMKNEDTITEQAVRVMRRATNRNILEALAHPETEAESRVARAYYRELAAHRKVLKGYRKPAEGRMTSYEARARRKPGYWGDGGHFILHASANGKWIKTPFGNELYLGECNKEHLEQARCYARGIVMGMLYRYKRPQIILSWTNKGVDTCLDSFL